MYPTKERIEDLHHSTVRLGSFTTHQHLSHAVFFTIMVHSGHIKQCNGKFNGILILMQLIFKKREKQTRRRGNLFYVYISS